MDRRTPLTAHQMWWQLRDKEAWWDKLFRFKVDEFFDDLLFVLDLPAVLKKDGYVQLHPFLFLLLFLANSFPPSFYNSHSPLLPLLTYTIQSHTCQADLAILMLLANLSSPRALRPDWKISLGKTNHASPASFPSV